MEIHKENSSLTDNQKKCRFYFSLKQRTLDWNNVVFTGWKKIGDVKMWGGITRFDCPLRLFYGSLRSPQYISILNEIILPMFNGNENLIVIQGKNKLNQSDLTRSWQASHPKLKFIYWPEKTKDIDPFKNIWFSLQERLDEESLVNPAVIYGAWRDTREDFDNFSFVYNDMFNRLAKVTKRFGDYID